MKEYKYKINGNTYNVTIGDIDDNMAQVEVNGVPYKVELEKAPAVKVASAPRPSAAPRTETGNKVISKPAATGGANAVKAPLPGVVLSINVKEGDTVKAADTILMLEAMKMENAIHAGRDGKVKSVNVKQGDSVLQDDVLVVIE
ncbi:MAG: biotin/lipoyl-binding protein [Bacteroidales bacterium]|mgnify:CR=1 FL=1|nr:biotin/lipoyl-binding protein [Bacteroidales bacterium]